MFLSYDSFFENIPSRKSNIIKVVTQYKKFNEDSEMVLWVCYESVSIFISASTKKYIETLKYLRFSQTSPKTDHKFHENVTYITGV